MMKRAAAAAILALAIFSCGGGDEERGEGPQGTGSAFELTDSFPRPAAEIERAVYVCRRMRRPPVIDGRIGEDEWKISGWTEQFTDIADPAAAPTRGTRARLAWDDDFLYFAAVMQETRITALPAVRDGDLWDGDCFEIFIDPDGDTHHYVEIAVSPSGAVLDLLLVRPYRDGGPALRGWDASGLLAGAAVAGTPEDPSDEDESWSVELAIPWPALSGFAGTGAPPAEGDIWRLNMSRTRWAMIVEDGRYVKATDPGTGGPQEPEISSWSAQGIDNMHYPEMWGMVKFTSSSGPYSADTFKPGLEEEARDALRGIYYAQKSMMLSTGSYSAGSRIVGVEDVEAYGYSSPPAISVTPTFFEAWMTSVDGTHSIRISHDGRIWKRIEGTE